MFIFSQNPIYVNLFNLSPLSGPFLWVCSPLWSMRTKNSPTLLLTSDSCKPLEEVEEEEEGALVR